MVLGVAWEVVGGCWRAYGLGSRLVVYWGLGLVEFKFRVEDLGSVACLTFSLCYLPSEKDALVASCAQRACQCNSCYSTTVRKREESDMASTLVRELACSMLPATV